MTKKDVKEVSNKKNLLSTGAVSRQHCLAYIQNAKMRDDKPKKLYQSSSESHRNDD